MSGMNRLSGLDASFLYLESSTQLLHVCGVVMISPETMPEEYSFESLKAGINRRIRVMPEFLRTLHTVPLHLDHPVWVVDDRFDIDRHGHVGGLLPSTTTDPDTLEHRSSSPARYRLPPADRRAGAHHRRHRGAQA